MGSSSVEGLGAIRSHKPAGLRPESLESLRQGLDELRQPVSDHAAGEERDLLGDVLAGLGVTHRAHQVHDLRNVRCLEGEHPLVITQAVEADHHESELPPMRDRLTMARRVRGYVLSGNEPVRGHLSEALEAPPPTNAKHWQPWAQGWSEGRPATGARGRVGELHSRQRERFRSPSSSLQPELTSSPCVGGSTVFQLTSRHKPGAGFR